MVRRSFWKQLAAESKDFPQLPTTSEIARVIEGYFECFFPSQAEESELEQRFSEWKAALSACLRYFFNEAEISALVERFESNIVEFYAGLRADAQAIEDGDPAARNLAEVVRCYPGFYAIAVYRLANFIHNEKVDYLPRLLTEHAHAHSGIDIHPAARIGSGFFIDHGTGVVIGETTHIGKRVKLYQGVTLGALSVKKELAQTKRHPSIEDDVVIYAGATILGGETVIGRGSVIGGNVWLTASVPPGSTVIHQPEISIKLLKNNGKTD